jgi:stearoyl-CoA desaturase (Delta-9 desaturase)
MEQEKTPILPRSILILAILPILTIIAVPYYGIVYGFNSLDWFWFGFFMISCGISITAGYHRLWSHRAYKSNIFFKIFFLIFGTASLQNSVIHWSSDHRKHHRFLDDPEKDPYAATKGFFFAHIGWMFRDTTQNMDDRSDVEDLKKDALLRFQDKYYTPLAVFACFILPLLIGASYGSAFGCFLLVGLARLVLIHHFTFFINSLAHFSGKKTYDAESTPRDNALVSLVTFGEGYHSFHHKFPGDYRNGINWYDFDPSKWIIFLSEKCNIAKNLKRTPQQMILKAKLIAEYKNTNKTSTSSTTNDYFALIEEQYQKYSKSILEWSQAQQKVLIAKKDHLIRTEVIIIKKQYKIVKKKAIAERKKWEMLLHKYSQPANV